MIRDKKKLLLIYELIMAAFALVVVVILIIEFTMPLTGAQKALLANIDLAILAIFAVDYFYRLARAKEKWQFVKSNIFDLIAIIPFDKAFRVARLVRLVRLVRLSRTSRLARVFRLSRAIRLFVFTRRFGNTISGIFKTNGLIYIILVTIGIVLLGAYGIMLFEDAINTYGDALWWSLVTTTALGYGDMSPESTGGRVTAGILMIVRIGFLGLLTGSITTFFIDRLFKGKEEDKPSIIDEQVEYVKSKLDEIENLSDEELDFLWVTIKAIRISKSK